MKEIISIIAATVVSFGFGILFNVRGKRLLLAALAGGVSWIMYHIAGACGCSENVKYLLAAAAVTGFAEIFARVVKTPATTFLAPGVIPMVPGGGLYSSMNYAMKEQWDLFSETALTTLELAAFIAIGIIAATSISRIYTAVRAAMKKELQK